MTRGGPALRPGLYAGPDRRLSQSGAARAPLFFCCYEFVVVAGELDLGRLEGLLEVLVRGAVVASRQRLALAGGALSRVRPALVRDAVEPEQLGARSRRSSASEILLSITFQTRSWSPIAKCTRTSLKERAGRAK